MSVRQNVRAIVLRDQSLLVMHRNKYGEQYYTLIGGGIEEGEDHEKALRRELREETSMEVGAMRHVFTEESSGYGLQHIYLCEYIGGEPKIAEDSEEAADNADGKNTYEPLWLPLSEIDKVTFRSGSVRAALLAAIASDFPAQAQQLEWYA